MMLVSLSEALWIRRYDSLKAEDDWLLLKNAKRLVFFFNSNFGRILQCLHPEGQTADEVNLPTLTPLICPGMFFVLFPRLCGTHNVPHLFTNNEWIVSSRQKFQKVRIRQCLFAVCQACFISLLVLAFRSFFEDMAFYCIVRRTFIKNLDSPLACCLSSASCCLENDAGDIVPRTGSKPSIFYTLGLKCWKNVE